MKITAITIENFKGISEPVRVELKPITLLFGANSVGKSTIVQALHYVREILERNNVDADRCLGADESLDLGGFENLVHNHDLNRAIRFRIEIDLFNDGLPTFPNEIFEEEIINSINPLISVYSAWIDLTIKWDITANKPFVSLYSVGYSDGLFVTIEKLEDGERAYISYLNLLHSITKDTNNSKNRFLLFELIKNIFTSNMTNGVISGCALGKYGSSVPPEWEISCIPQWNFCLYFEIDYVEDFYQEKHKNYKQRQEDLAKFWIYVSQLISGAGKILLGELKKSRYIGPIRKIPPRNYSPPRHNDETRWSSGLAAWDLLYKTHLVPEVSEWMSRKDRLNSGYSLRMLRYKKLDMTGELYKVLAAKRSSGKSAAAVQLLELPEEQQLLLTDEKRRLDVLPQDVGIGISQILPVVVGALDRNTGILMVEQPELHIHPALQTSIGDLFISQIQKEGKTFIIETHSEHLLLRLLRRIRETNDGELPEGVDSLTPEQVSVNYIELTEDGLRIRPMHISEDGDSLGEWPRGFFEERAKELL